MKAFVDGQEEHTRSKLPRKYAENLSTGFVYANEASVAQRISPQSVAVEVHLVSPVVLFVAMFYITVPIIYLYSQDRDMDTTISLLDEAGVITDGVCSMAD